MQSVRYHKIFDFELTDAELIKWQYKNYKEKGVIKKNKKRLQREIYSKYKLKIAKKAANLISKIPSVLFIGATGSLAMMNAKKESDIDLMIITKNNYLWTTRALVYFLLLITGFKLRRSSQKDEKDKLCINLWLDENDLVWDKKDRNVYTAHEIAQVVPLVNKKNTYEKFLYLNKWIFSFWPNSVKIRRYEGKVVNQDLSLLSLVPLILEKFVFKLQYLYMKPKITREVISPSKAIFHPKNWGEVVMKKLSS